CLHCDDGTELVHGARNLAISVRQWSDIVPAVTGWHCPVCGEVEFDPGEGVRYNAAVEALHARAAKADAAALRAIRKRLKLSQAQAALIAGGGHNAFSRYERGDTRPVAAVMNLFSLLDKHPELLAEVQDQASRRRPVADLAG
ncbi:MAG TPA: type II toxin-antitoxin system MqsA family antitoxin, partial [Xanthomonadales bacterium]|nr:type II toxin-antitoxin system MqsA family antitoxin [Xanthomonadales bacterium]